MIVEVSQIEGTLNTRLNKTWNEISTAYREGIPVYAKVETEDMYRRLYLANVNTEDDYFYVLFFDPSGDQNYQKIYYGTASASGYPQTNNGE